MACLLVPARSAIVEGRSPSVRPLQDGPVGEPDVVEARLGDLPEHVAVRALGEQVHRPANDFEPYIRALCRTANARRLGDLRGPRSLLYIALLVDRYPNHADERRGLCSTPRHRGWRAWPADCTRSQPDGGDGLRDITPRGSIDRAGAHVADDRDADGARNDPEATGMGAPVVRDGARMLGESSRAPLRTSRMSRHHGVQRALLSLFATRRRLAALAATRCAGEISRRVGALIVVFARRAAQSGSVSLIGT